MSSIYLGWNTFGSNVKLHFIKENVYSDVDAQGSEIQI